MNRKPSVDPTFAFGIALAVSLVLWWPTLQNTMHGDLDITDAGIRYFLALAISWAGVYGICALVAQYASNPRPKEPPPGATEDHPLRRRNDPFAASDAPPDIEDVPEPDAA